MKHFAIIGIILFIIGLILFVIGMFFVGWDFTKISTKLPYLDKTHTSSSEISNITLSDKNVKISVFSTKEDKIHIDYMENEYNYYIISEENGTLIFEKESKVNWRDLISLNFVTPEIKIYLPENYRNDLEINAENSVIKVEQNDFKDLILKTANASVEAKQIEVEGTFTAETKNGAIRVNDANVENDFQAITKNSKISLENISAKNIEAKSANGSINLNNVASNEKIYCKTANSDVNIFDISGEIIELFSANGDIKGEIIGDIDEYSITSDVSNGDSNLPEKSVENSDKMLNADTSNGDIEISFIKKQ